MFQLAQGSTPEEIIAGPDGNMWVTLFSRHGVARITPAGAISEFLLPDSQGNPSGITLGGDGALWFSLAQFPGVGRVTTDGAIAAFAVAGAGPGGASGIASGSDGALWLTYPAANRIGRLTLAGAYTEVALSTPGAKPQKVVGIAGRRRLVHRERARPDRARHSGGDPDGLRPDQGVRLRHDSAQREGDGHVGGPLGRARRPARGEEAEPRHTGPLQRGLLRGRAGGRAEGGGGRARRRRLGAPRS